MAAPVYPTILTKADWDERKGAIGKDPTELGIAAAVDAAWNEWRQIEWSIALECRPGHLKILPRSLILYLAARLQYAVPRVAAARAAFLELGKVTGDVVARYERAATFPKPAIDHVREMSEAAIAFAAELEKNNLQREALMARKAKGYSRLCEYDLDAFLDDPRLAKLYLPAAKSSFCGESWQFLMATRCALNGTPPAAEKVPQIYRDFVANNDADLGIEQQKALVALHDDGVLVAPPAASAETVRKAWEAAHRECQKMFPGRYRQWRNLLALDDNEGLLLDPALQA